MAQDSEGAARNPRTGSRTSRTGKQDASSNKWPSKHSKVVYLRNRVVRISDIKVISGTYAGYLADGTPVFQYLARDLPLRFLGGKIRFEEIKLVVKRIGARKATRYSQKNVRLKRRGLRNRRALANNFLIEDGKAFDFSTIDFEGSSTLTDLRRAAQSLTLTSSDAEAFIERPLPELGNISPGEALRQGRGAEVFGLLARVAGV